MFTSPLMATDGPPSKEGLPLLNTSVRKIHQAPAIGESLGGEKEKVNLTFFPFSGQAEFYREEYNLILGRQLNVWGVGLFSSNGFDGALIREVSGFNWSHVGMILVDEKTKDLFCFQSTAKVDKLLQGVMPQVQISKWDEEVREYDGKVACRALIFSDKRPDSEIVMNYIKENLGRSYETNLLSLIKATNNSNKQESLDALFCSEMSADLLIKLGFLTRITLKQGLRKPLF